MNVRMFSSLAVADGDRRLGAQDFGGPTPRAVFELLLLARGHLVSKDALAEALWGDDLPVNTSAALETHVSVLRRHLVSDRTRARALVVTGRGAYRLELSDVVVDLFEFERHVDASRTARPCSRRRHLERALDLVAGDLLEDEPYAQWVQAERDRVRTMVIDARLALADLCHYLGDATTALQQAEAVLTLDPLVEGAYRAAMQAHHALGRRDRAVATYRLCREQLNTELGVEPSCETVALGDAIEAGTYGRFHATPGSAADSIRSHGGAVRPGSVRCTLRTTRGRYAAAYWRA